eukprot:COSAG01_NODE_2005_length_8668_cov_6.555257_1_plen_33_part_10
MARTAADDGLLKPVRPDLLDNRQDVVAAITLPL